MIINIVPVQRSHLPALKNMIDKLGLFPSEFLDGMMSDFFTNPATTDRWYTGLLDDHPITVVYFAPEKLTEGTHNLYLIAVDPDFEGKGIGSYLLKFVENNLIQSGARVLIVETSGLPEFQLTRKFYEKHGYHHEATIRDFYKDGDDKVVFWKKLKIDLLPL